jgi:hypothetical protein
MRVTEFKKLLTAALPKRRRVLGVGKPGTGKSYAVADVCAEMGWDLISLCAPLQSPVKVGGYPRPPSVEGGDASHCLFDGIARAFRANKPTVLLWDDLGMAGGETLKAIVEIVQFGRIDGRVLPDCVVQCALTNDVGQGCIDQSLNEALKTRWETIVNVESHVDDTVVYGMARQWPSDELAFLRNAPDALHDWKPSKTMQPGGATPRGWDYVGQWINDGVDDPEVIAGCVGKDRATQYLAFRDLRKELPDVDEVLLNPERSPVPENPSARLLISMALASKMTAGNFGQCLTYLKRLPKMLRVFAIKDAFKAEAARRDAKTLPNGWQKLQASKDFSAWVTSEDGKMVGSI